MATADLIALYLTALDQRGCTEATLHGYRRFLTLADRRLPYGLDQADEHELRGYLFRRDPRPLAPGTRRTYHTVIHGFYQWAVQSRLLRMNPMDTIAAPRAPHYVPRAAEDHQVRWVITEAAEPFRLWGTIAAFSNLRCLEVSRLRREHVTAHDITVMRGKGDRPRIVPTHPLVWSAVRELPAGPVTDQDAYNISARFWKYCVRKGMRELSMHRLRGWYATQGYAATKDLLAVQRNMGHKDPRTTAGYIRTSADQARAVVDGLPTFGLERLSHCSDVRRCGHDNLAEADHC